jgi:hypothetical protein
LLSAVAERAGARFVGLWLDAPLDVLIDRVTARAGDASDATAGVVRAQASEPLDGIAWARLNASVSLDTLAEAALAVVARE